MTKKTSIIIISVIIIIISLAMSIYLPNKNKIKEEKIDTSIVYSITQKDGKFGVSDQTQKVIIEPQYEKIIIPNQHKAVFLCKSEDSQKFVNENNEEIFQEYNQVNVIELFNLGIYERDVLTYEKDGKYGLLGINGTAITDAKFDEISTLGNKAGELLVKENNKYGIMYDNTTYKIRCKYDLIESDGYYSNTEEYKKSGYIVCNVTNEGYRYGYYDYDGIQVLEEKYNQIARLTEVNSNDIYLVASENGQHGVFVNNSKIINTQYQSIDYNSDIGMFIVERTGQFGAINSKGLEILKTEYSELKVNGIYMYAIKGEEQKVFDEKGEEVDVPFNSFISKTANSKYLIKSQDGRYSILNAELEEISKQNYNFIEYAYDKYFIATDEQNRVGLIDLEENVIIEFNYDLIQVIKDKYIIQAINFETNQTDIYDKEFDLALEISNSNIEILKDGIRVYNNENEHFLDDNGEIITK